MLNASPVGFHQHSSHHPAHYAKVRAPFVAAAAAQRQAADYTLVHAGRQLRLGPMAFWVVVGTLVIMAAWSITTATYFAFRDDVLTRLVSREAEMQFGYEDRIAELRAQIDRLSSRQLLDQERYEQKLDQVSHGRPRWNRAPPRSAHCRPGHHGSIRPPARSGLGAPQRAAPLKPSPLGDATKFVPAAARNAGLDANQATRRLALTGSDNTDGMLAGIQASLDRVEPGTRLSSTPSKKPTIPKRSACAGCWPISVSTPKRSRQRPKPASRAALAAHS